MAAYGRKRRINYRGSLVLMFAALTLLFVFLANVAPGLRILLYFVASMFIFGVMQEGMTGAAFAVFGIVAFLGFVIVPDKAGMLPYLFFFGWYGIFKYIVENASRRGKGVLAAKLITFNVGLALIYFFGGGFMTALLPFKLPVWAVWALAEVIFLVYDWLFSKISDWYYHDLRGALTGQSRM